MPRPPTFLRSADKLLVSSAYKALGGAAGSYQMPVRKIVFEVNAKLPSHHGLRYFVLHRMGVVELAKTYPFVEFVVKDRPNSNPLIRGFYSTSSPSPLFLLYLFPSFETISRDSFPTSSYGTQGEDSRVKRTP